MDRVPSWVLAVVLLCVVIQGPARAQIAPQASIEQAVMLDTFRLPTDPDDTASMARAVGAGVPILLGPKTYFVHDYSMAGTPSKFVLKGVQGTSVIRRAAASGSQFFAISAQNVSIDGVTFDMNKASVTANQWGVFLGSCNQNVTIKNSGFKNNSGNLGAGLALICSKGTGGGAFTITDNEISGNSFNALYLASVVHGLVARNYVHDNSGTGIFASAYLAASPTNYLSDVIIDSNRVVKSGNIGISVGGYAPPYSLATPPALRVRVTNNTLKDNFKYGISIQGDSLTAVANSITKSSPSVATFGGIVCLARYTTVSSNTITLLHTPWGIDCGGSVQATVTGNSVTVSQGTALNTGGNQSSLFSGNHLMVSGTAIGIHNQAIDADGSGNPFPTVTSGNTLEDNTIDMVDKRTVGMYFADNSGGRQSANPTVVKNNRFNVTGAGTSSAQDIKWRGGTSSSIIIGENLHNGANQIMR